MKDYTIAESYVLPSKGKIYDKEINPNVTLRSMTTEEEMKRLSPSDRPYKVLSEIIDDCLVEKLGISAYDLCLGDYQFLLHKLRIVTYGADYKSVSTCPFCGCKNENTINLENLEVLEFTDDLLNKFEIDLPRTKKHIKLRMQTPRLLDDVNANAKELRRKAPNMTGDPAFLFTLESLIAEVDGKKLDILKQSDFVRALPMMDTNYIMKYAQKLNDKIGLSTAVETDCKVCGLTYSSSFRITTEFFGPSIDA